MSGGRTNSDGGPAFPAEIVRQDPNWTERKMVSHMYPGMSLRDYFAAWAMHAEFLSDNFTEAHALALAEGAQKHGHGIEEHIAFNAYKIADAMLVERAKAEGK